MTDAEIRVNTGILKYNKMRLHQSINYQTLYNAHKNCERI